jgi:hypothetical protein
MIRLAVFTVIGPLTGYFIFIGLGGGIKGDAAGAVFGMLLPVAWVAGLGPASITAALDKVFERLGSRSVQPTLTDWNRRVRRVLVHGRELFRGRTAVSVSIRLGSHWRHPRVHLLVRNRKTGNSSLALNCSIDGKPCNRTAWMPLHNHGAGLSIAINSSTSMRGRTTAYWSPLTSTSGTSARVL